MADRIARWCRENGFSEEPIEGTEADATQFVSRHRRIEIVDDTVRLTNEDGHYFTGIDDVELSECGIQLHDAVQIPLSPGPVSSGTGSTSESRGS